jgi:diaminopimelate epimerase
MRTLGFVKMSGTGNDFVLVDNRKGAAPEDAKAPLARAVCPRRTAVGADGLILLEPSEVADVRMRIFNADGSEPEMCGNGSRCLAHFAQALGAAGDEMKIETLAGVLHAKVDGPRVRVELTRPEEVVSRGELEFAGERREVFYTNTGVPHAAVFVDDIEGVPVREWGKALRFHEEFGDPGANADFVKILGPGKIALRTYERGVEDETLACGTGAVASALIAAWRENWPSPVAVQVRSGEELEISFLGSAPRYDAAFLEGAVAVTFRGEVEFDAL